MLINLQIQLKINIVKLLCLTTNYLLLTIAGRIGEKKSRTFA